MREKSLTQHTFFYFVATVVPSIFSFAGLMVFTRWLNPHDYGMYYITYSTAILAFSVLYGGVGMAINRFCPAVDLFKNLDLSGTINTLLLMASVLGLLVYAATFLFIKPQLRLFYFLGVLIFISQGIYYSILDYMRSQLLSTRYAFFNCMKAAMTFMIAVIFLYNGQTATSPLWGQCIANFILITLLLVTPRYQCVPFKFVWHADTARELLKYGMPLALGFALLYIVNNTDRWLLTSMQSLSAAGLYSAAFSFPLYTLTALMTVVNSAGYPLIVKAYNDQNIQKARKIFSDQFTMFLIIILPICIGFVIFQKPLVEITLGQKYHETAQTLMPWFVSATFFAGLKSTFADVCFQLSKRSMLQMMLTLMIAVINIVLNIIFIPRWGVSGAAYASFAAFFIGFLASILWNIKNEIISVNLLHIIKVMIAVFIFSLLCLFFPEIHNQWVDLSVRALTAGGCYILLIYFLFNFKSLKWR